MHISQKPQAQKDQRTHWRETEDVGIVCVYVWLCARWGACVHVCAVCVHMFMWYVCMLGRHVCTSGCVHVSWYAHVNMCVRSPGVHLYISREMPRTLGLVNLTQVPRS